jgi:hypothetical protein
MRRRAVLLACLGLTLLATACGTTSDAKSESSEGSERRESPGGSAGHGGSASGAMAYDCTVWWQELYLSLEGMRWRCGER